MKEYTQIKSDQVNNQIGCALILSHFLSLNFLTATPCTETGYWYGGKDLKDINNIPDAKTCHKECEKEGGCKYWIYFSQKFVPMSDAKKCWLKRHDFDKDNSQKSLWIPGVISSHKTCPTDKTNSCSEEGYWYDGDELENQVAIDAAKSCQQFCKENTACKYWIYINSTFPAQKIMNTHLQPMSCWLKRSTPADGKMNKATTKISGITAGTKECGQTTQGSGSPDSTTDSDASDSTTDSDSSKCQTNGNGNGFCKALNIAVQIENDDAPNEIQLLSGTYYLKGKDANGRAHWGKSEAAFNYKGLYFKSDSWIFGLTGRVPNDFFGQIDIKSKPTEKKYCPISDSVKWEFQTAAQDGTFKDFGTLVKTTFDGTYIDFGPSDKITFTCLGKYRNRHPFSMQTRFGLF